MEPTSLHRQSKLLNPLPQHVLRRSASLVGLEHSFDVLVREHNEQLAFLRPILANRSLAPRVAPGSRNDHGQQSGAMGLQVVENLQSLSLSHLGRVVLGIYDKKVRRVS